MAMNLKTLIYIFFLLYYESIESTAASTTTMSLYQNTTTLESTTMTAESTTTTAESTTTPLESTTTTAESTTTTAESTTTTIESTTTTAESMTTTTDLPFAIRLENGMYNNSGRVGVYYEGQWGGICDRDWTFNDANVACRMLGYTNGTLVPSRYYTQDSVWYKWYGNDTDTSQIQMNNVMCSGTETSLADCPFDGWSIGECSIGDDNPYVFCYIEDDSPMEIRLVNGRSDGYGNVEVHYSSYWGGVDYSVFFDNEAKVVCRMLGYSGGIHYGGSLFEYTTIPKWMARRCTGAETSYADCPFYTTDTYYNLGIATALCYNQSQGPNEEQPVFLIDGNSRSTGAVEIIFGGQRTTVCGISWDDTEAGIVCRMLGFRNGTAKYYPRYNWDTVEDAILKIVVNCSGSESSIYECTFSNVQMRCPYDHEEDRRGGVICSEPYARCGLYSSNIV